MTPLGSKYYDRLKFITQIVLPALGTLYFALAGIWGLPSADQVVGTIIAVDTFLGVILSLSSSAYNNNNDRFSGTLHVGDEDKDGMQNFRLEIPLDAQAVASQKELVLKVKHPE